GPQKKGIIATVSWSINDNALIIALLSSIHSFYFTVSKIKLIVIILCDLLKLTNANVHLLRAILKIGRLKLTFGHSFYAKDCFTISAPRNNESRARFERTVFWIISNNVYSNLSR